MPLEQVAEIEEHSPEGGFTDEGISVHVVSVADDHEYLRFDMFEQEPHYHYIHRSGEVNNVVEFDRVARDLAARLMDVEARFETLDLRRGIDRPLLLITTSDRSLRP